MRFVRPIALISLLLSAALVGGCEEGSRKALPGATSGEGEGEAGDEGGDETGGEVGDVGGDVGGTVGGELGGEGTQDDLCIDVECEIEGGGVCDQNTGRCVNADPCDDTSECIEGFICLSDSRKCVEDLCEGFECDRGVCDPSIEDANERCVEPEVCTEDAECLDPDAVCNDEGKCDDPCWALADDGFPLFECEEGTFCDASGHCLADPDTCETDDDCPTSDIGHRVCAGGECEDSCATVGCWEGRCDEETGHCEQPEVCVGSFECLGDLVCIDGACTDPSDDPRGDCDAEECPAPMTCNDFGECADPDACELDDDCATGNCNEDSGTCVVCQFDEDCPGSQTCLMGLACTEPDVCVDDVDCAGDRSCVDDACVAGECVADGFEPEAVDGEEVIDGPETAPEIGDGLFSGLTICDADEDWFYVWLPAGSGMHASIRFNPGDGDLDLDIFDGSDPETPIDTSANIGLPTERAVFDLAQEDSWALIHVYGAGDDDTSVSYDLSVTLVDGLACEPDFLDEAQVGNSMEDAAFFGVGAIVDNVNICAGDADWYATALENGETLVIDAAFEIALGDLDVNIIDDSGASVAEGQPWEDGGGKSARWTANGPGVFWISVAGVDGDVVNLYELSASKFYAAGLVECQQAIDLEVNVTYQGNTEESGSDHLSTCGGGGDASPDAVHSFTLAKPSIVTIDVIPDGWDAIAYLRSDCSAVGSEIDCVDDPEVINALLDPGTYYVIVDAARGGGGDYEIYWEVQDPICLPGERGCVGNLAAICVDDGSGYEPLGQCEGVCNEDTGTCDVPDDTCSSPSLLEDGVTFSGSTVGVGDDYATGCTTDAVSGDRVFSWTQDTRGGVRVNLESPQGMLSWSIRSSCRGPDSELTCNYALGGDGLFILDPGEYFVIVDGAGVEGEFDLTVSSFDMGCDLFEDNQRCSPEDPEMLQVCSVDVDLDEITFWEDSHLCEHGCEDDYCIVANDSCEDGELLIAGALTSGDTRGTNNDANPTCDAASDAGETFHRLVLDEQTGVDIQVVDADFPALLHVREDCDLQGSEVACALPVTFFGLVLENARWVGVLEAGTYHVAVDGVADGSGQYGLLYETFEQACDPADEPVCDGDVLLYCSDDGREVVELLCADGCNADEGRCNVAQDSCADAGPIDLGGSVEGSLAGAGDDYQVLACPFGGGDGPDHVYFIEVAERGVVTATLEALTGSDMVLSMRRTACDQAFLETHCVDDNVATPGLPRGVGEQVQGLVEPGTYFIFVDTWGGLGAGDSGDYRLSVDFELAICEPEATECTEDAASVRACIGGTEWSVVEDCPEGCLDGACIEEEGGDCEEPRPIDELGVAYMGNTAGFEAVDSGSCQVGEGPVVVYTVDIAEDSWVTGSLEGSNFDTVMWVREGDCAEGDEVACDDDTFGAQSGVGLPVEGGTTLYFFVGGFNGRTGDFHLVVDATPLVCWPGEEMCGVEDEEGWMIRCSDDGAEWMPVMDCPHGCDVEAARCDVPNDVCGEDTPQIDPGQEVVDTTEFGTNDYSGTCNVGNANDTTYSFVLADVNPDEEDIFGVVIELNSEFSGHFYVRSDCDDRASEVACAPGGGGLTRWTGVLPEGTYYIVVDGVGFNGGNEGAYTLSLDTYVPECVGGDTRCDGSILRTCVDDGSGWRSFECPGVCDEPEDGPAACLVENDDCDTAEAVPAGEWVSGDTRAARDDYAGSCAGQGGEDVVYAIEVPEAGQDELGWGVTLDFQWEAGSQPPVVYMRQTCERGITEVDGVCGLPSTPWGDPSPISTPLTDPGTYYVFVDAAPNFGIDAGEFAMRYELYPLVCEPRDTWCDEEANTFNLCNAAGDDVTVEDCGAGFCEAGGCILPGDTCELPHVVEVDPLDDGGSSAISLAGTSTGFSNDYSPGCGFSSGPDVFYEIAVPEGSFTADVVLTAEPFPDGFDTFVAVLGGACDDGPEIGCNDDSGGTRRSAALGIDVTQEETIYVVVTGWSANNGDFNLDVSFAGEPPPPPDPCDSVLDLEAGVQGVGDTSLSDNDWESECIPFANDTDDLWTFGVERTAWVVVDVIPDGWDATLQISEGRCGESAALECSDDPEYFEGVLEPGVYTALIDGWFAAGAYTIDLTVTEGDCFDADVTMCDGDTLRTCDLDTFSWVDGEVCANGCVDGGCQVECEPVGDTMCADDQLKTCQEDNTWDDGEFCPFGCEDGACLPECSPGGIRECAGDVPRMCDDETLEWVAEDACEHGCVNGACRPANDQCGEGVVGLEDGVLIQGSTMGSSNDTSGTCAFGNAPDDFYGFTVADGTDGIQIAFQADFNGFYYIQSQCGDRDTEVQCGAPVALGGEPAPPPVVEAAEAAESCAEAEVMAVDFGGGVNQSFTLVGNSLGAAADDGNSCSFGGDVVWAFTVNSPAVADVVMGDNDFDAGMALYAGGCAAENELGCSDFYFAGGPEQLRGAELVPDTVYYIVVGDWGQGGAMEIDVTLTNLGEALDTRYFQLDPGDYTLVVDGWGADAENRRGDYRLGFVTFDAECTPDEVWCDFEGNLRTCNFMGTGELEARACVYGCDRNLLECRSAPNDTCEAATPIGANGEWGDSRYAANTFEAPVDALCGAEGTEVFYGMSLDACAVVTVQVSPDIDNVDAGAAAAAATFDASVFILDGCPAADGASVTCSDDTGAGAAESVQVQLEAGEYTIAVDSRGAGGGGPFVVDVLTEACPADGEADPGGDEG